MGVAAMADILCHCGKSCGTNTGTVGHHLPFWAWFATTNGWWLWSLNSICALKLVPRSNGNVAAIAEIFCCREQNWALTTTWLRCWTSWALWERFASTKNGLWLWSLNSIPIPDLCHAPSGCGCDLRTSAVVRNSVALIKCGCALDIMCHRGNGLPQANGLRLWSLN